MHRILGHCFNALVQLILVVLFLMLFGIPSIQKYLDKETIIVSSEEEINGIEAPAITVFVLKNTVFLFSKTLALV